MLKHSSAERRRPSERPGSVELLNTTFLEACARREPEYTPVWFMRQAGRYLPSYRKIKGNLPITEVAKNSDLASELAVDAVRQLGVDAAIIFADIMLPLEGMGIRFRIEENIGPIVENSIRSLDDVTVLRDFDPERDASFVYDGIEATISKLNDSVPLIGFSGAPFTLAGYIIEGAPSRELERTRALIYSQPETWKALMERLTRMVKEYLRRQVKHGVRAVQLFDSWVGCLSKDDYEQYVFEYTKDIFDSLDGVVPRIHFCANSGLLIESFQKVGPDVMSVDWRVSIDEVWRRTKEQLAVQGNLDPALALAGGETMESKVRGILESASGQRGHIFNLGHGVLRETPPENARRIVEIVHKETKRS